MVAASDIILENKKRLDALFAPYDPLSGLGSPIDRFPITYYVQKDKPLTVWLPLSMKEEPIIKALIQTPDVSELAPTLFKGKKNPVELFFGTLTNIRFKHDFEFWSYLTCVIEDKESGKPIPFKCRLAQRFLLKTYEDMRLGGLPIRAVVLKARQWGGSTLTQMYMLWIQVVLTKNWHSAVCTHVEEQAKHIRGMYVNAANTYPRQVGAITLTPYQGSSKTKFVEESGSLIAIGSMQEPENLRTFSFKMVHWSEVGSFKETQGKKPEDFMQNIRSSIPNVPLTMEVLESTAKGVGNFFHREWQSAESKSMKFRSVFVPWFMIDLYIEKIENYEAFIKSMTEYQWYQWECGATLEGIKWYNSKQVGDNYSDWRMQSEFPGTPDEAFQNTGSRVFNPRYVKQMRKNCMDPEFKGKLFSKGRKGKDAFIDLEFGATPEGELWVWVFPDKTVECINRYIITADIGGRSEGADFSTVRVLDRYWTQFGGPLYAVATWRGHIDQDLFGWICAQIAFIYNEGLLIVEANSLRKEQVSSEGSHYLTLLDEIAEYYENIFTRISPEKVKGENALIYGFHTNSSSKTLAINAMNGAMRDQSYVEYDSRVMDEADSFENKPDGSQGATQGSHDDLVMPTAIGIWADGNPIAIGPCKEVDRSKGVVHKRIVNESSM